MVAKRKQLRKVHIDGEVWKYLPMGSVIWSPLGKRYEFDYRIGSRFGNMFTPSEVKRYIEEEILGRKQMAGNGQTAIS